MSAQKHTFCRICEPACPLVADFDEAGRVARLSPDVGHPSGGIACHKGLSFLDVHNDPDRLNWPQKRLNSRSEARGDFVDTDWNAAMAEIGASMKAIREQYGPNSVAIYMGNPWAFNAAGLMMAGVFKDTLQSVMRFSANTQDTANKLTAAGQIYGSEAALMVPDIYKTDYLLCLGANPKVSRWTVLSAPNNPEVLKDIRRRGGKVRFVNPRQIESSTEETGPTLCIKPGTDVYFLAAVLNEINVLNGFQPRILEAHGKNIEGLKAFIRLYPSERVARVTGIDAQSIKTVAAEIVAAKSAAVYVSTGVNQSRQGILAFWMAEMINFVTGNLGREGGAYKPTGLMDYFPPAGASQTVQTSVGAFELPDPIGYAGLPGVILPDLIENGDIRALITLGGNPVLSMGGEARMRKACERLDLMVSVDLYRSATGEMADFVLPGTDWLERPDINLLGSGLQPIPYVQYTEAMEPPAAGRRNDWWILCRLIQAFGLPSPLDATVDQADGAMMVDGILAARGLSIETLKATPRQTVAFDQGPRDSLFGWCLQHPDKKIDCCPPAFDATGLFERCATIFAELEQEPADTLKLISLRTPYIHNTWLANTERYRRGKQSTNPLNMCEADAASRGLFNGDAIRVSTVYGEMETQVFINDDMRPGAVAMSHGFGQQKSYGQKVASENPGANCNTVMPVGVGTFEPASYMSWLSGVPVNVEKIARS